MAKSGRGSREWRVLSARLKTELLPICHLCKEAIDLRLPHTHRDSWTLDHKTPLAAGGSLTDVGNLAPAHRRCNSLKGVGRWTPEAGKAKGSRNW